MERRSEEESRAGADASGTALSSRLSRWRRYFGGRGRRLPEWVWDLAVDRARLQGAERVSRDLRLNAETLERRLRQNPARSSAHTDATPAFVEIGPIERSAVEGCVVEVSSPAGTRLTIRVSDPSRLDFSALAAAFLQPGGADR